MTIESRLHRGHGALTTLTNGRHAWAADIDKTLDVTDAAPSAHDLLLSALAACAALTLALYSRHVQPGAALQCSAMYCAWVGIWSTTACITAFTLASIL